MIMSTYTPAHDAHHTRKDATMNTPSPRDSLATFNAAKVAFYAGKIDYDALAAAADAHIAVMKAWKKANRAKIAIPSRASLMR